MKIYSYTDKHGKKVNEDYLRFVNINVDNSDDILIAAVADGVSKSNRPSEVSKSSVLFLFQEAVRRFCSDDFVTALNPSSRCEILKNWINEVAYDLNEKLLTEFPYIDIGTTLSFVCIYLDNAFVFGCGDSPVFLYKKDNDTLKLVLELDNYENTNALTQCFGFKSSDIKAHTDHIKLSKGDIIFIGSDGAFAVPLSQSIEEVLKKEIHADIDKEKNIANDIISISKKYTLDNQTLIVIKY